jgi:molybdopterin-guanine dinucleotide biosynthesis protein A
MRVGGIILCGGESRRMGKPKAALPFGSETVLARIVRTVAGVVEPVVLVRRPQQELPPLPFPAFRSNSGHTDEPAAAPECQPRSQPSLILAEDVFAGEGPLAGIHAGLLTLQEQVTHALVVSCDVPLVSASFLTRLITIFQQANASRSPGAPPFLACVPVNCGQRHPLVALYACAVLPIVERLLQAGLLRPAFLLQEIPVRWIHEHEWADMDPHSLSLLNINTPADYELALRYLELTNRASDK